MFTKLVRVTNSVPACHGGLAKYQKCLIFHRPPHNCAHCFVMDLYGLSVTLPIFSYNCNHLVLKNLPSCRVKYEDPISREAINTNRPVVNITDLTWTRPDNTESLSVLNRTVGNITQPECSTSCWGDVTDPIFSRPFFVPNFSTFATHPRVIKSIIGSVRVKHHYYIKIFP